jgi:hypothetical protein
MKPRLVETKPRSRVPAPTFDSCAPADPPPATLPLFSAVPVPSAPTPFVEHGSNPRASLPQLVETPYRSSARPMLSSIDALSISGPGAGVGRHLRRMRQR